MEAGRPGAWRWNAGCNPKVRKEDPMKRSTFAIIVAAALGAAACVIGPEPAAPAEPQAEVRPQAFPEAAYEIQTRAGVLGATRIDSSGAYAATVEGRSRTVIQVGFLIENHSDRPLLLDNVSLDSTDVGERRLMDLQPVAIESQPATDGGAQRSVDAYFLLPPGIAPQDVSAFRVSWRLRSGQLTYAQRTPFVEHEQAFYYTPYYDPFFHSPTPEARPSLSVNRGSFRHYAFF
jgi:hypothetical protein